MFFRSQVPRGATHVIRGYESLDRSGEERGINPALLAESGRERGLESAGAIVSGTV